MDEQAPSEHHQNASSAQPAVRAPSNRNHARLSLAPLTSLDANNASSSSSRARFLPQGKSAPNTPGHNHNHHNHHRNNTTSATTTTTSAPVSRATSSAHLPGPTTSSSTSSLYGGGAIRRHRPRPRYAPPEPTFLDKCQAIGHALGGFVREERGQTSTWTRRDEEKGLRRSRSRGSFLTPFEELYGGEEYGYGGSGDGVGEGEKGEESADPAYREYARLKREEAERRDGVYSPGYGHGLNGGGGGSASSRLQSRRGSAVFLPGGGSVPLTPRTPREDYFGSGPHQARTPRRSGVEGMVGMGRATVPEEADFVDLELLRVREREEAEEREADAQANLRRYISERRSGTWPWFLSWFGLPLYEPLDVEQEEEYKAWDAEGAAEAEELEREAAERCRQRRARVLEDKEFTFEPPREQGNMLQDYVWLSTLAVSLLRG